MDAGLLLQYALVALAVVLSAGHVAKRQWPGAVRTLRIACASRLLRERRATWPAKLGRWIAPPVRTEAGSCGTGCQGCGPTPPRR